MRDMVALEQVHQISAIFKAFVKTFSPWVKRGNMHKNKAGICVLRLFQRSFDPLALRLVQPTVSGCIENNKFISTDGKTVIGVSESFAVFFGRAMLKVVVADNRDERNFQIILQFTDEPPKISSSTAGNQIAHGDGEGSLTPSIDIFQK